MINKGDKYGALTIVSLNEEKSTKKHKYWNCICDCGNIFTIRQDHLVAANNPNCGCLTHKKRIKAKKHNDYVFADNYVIFSASNTHNAFYVDREDFEKVYERCWYEDESGYIKTRMEGKLISLHRYIMNITDINILIDHIDRNTRNNRKSNLRKATKSQNGMNRLEPSNNTSGFRGVHYNKDKHKWQVKIQRYIEYCDSYEHAVKRRLELEDEIFGSFAPK